MQTPTSDTTLFLDIQHLKSSHGQLSSIVTKNPWEVANIQGKLLICHCSQNKIKDNRINITQDGVMLITSPNSRKSWALFKHHLEEGTQLPPVTYGESYSQSS